METRYQYDAIIEQTWKRQNYGSIEAVAEVVGCSEPTVRAAIERILENQKKSSDTYRLMREELAILKSERETAASMFARSFSDENSTHEQTMEILRQFKELDEKIKSL